MCRRSSSGGAAYRNISNTLIQTKIELQRSVTHAQAPA